MPCLLCPSEVVLGPLPLGGTATTQKVTLWAKAGQGYKTPSAVPYEKI